MKAYLCKSAFLSFLGLSLTFINMQEAIAMEDQVNSNGSPHSTRTIFDPITLGNYQIPNRIIMAPMTRGRSDAGAIPSSIMVDYYAARSDAGLIIAEATTISSRDCGWLNAPGIWNDAQEKGWKAVTSAVHTKGGHIFLQLRHAGRVSHPDFLEGALPVGPSEIAALGTIHTPLGKKSYVTPRALTIEEISSVVADYASGAKRAMAAGFDGVEIHGAYGYLIDQFTRDGSNKRTDNYGGTTDNRLRFLMEVTNAVVNAVGDSGKVGVRLSPTNEYNGMSDSNPIETFTRAAELLNPLKLAYLHAVEGAEVTPHIRKIYQGILIINSGYSKDLANAALKANKADAIAFGTPFISNPDLVYRYRENLPIALADPDTYYTQGPIGYTDYASIKNNS